MTVDPPLVALGQAEPTLQVQIVPDLLERALADEEARQEADHHHGHVAANRVLGPLEAIDQRLERLLPRRDGVPSGFEGRGDFLDVLDVVADRLLLGPDCVEAPVDAAGQPAELLLGEPPFCSSRLRWIDSRTSSRRRPSASPADGAVPPGRR